MLVVVTVSGNVTEQLNKNHQQEDVLVQKWEMMALQKFKRSFAKLTVKSMSGGMMDGHLVFIDLLKPVGGAYRQDKSFVLRKKIYLGSPHCKIHTATKSQSQQNSVFAVHHVLENVWLVNGQNGQSVVFHAIRSKFKHEREQS